MGGAYFEFRGKGSQWHAFDPATWDELEQVHAGAKAKCVLSVGKATLEVVKLPNGRMEQINLATHGERDVRRLASVDRVYQVEAADGVWTPLSEKLSDALDKVARAEIPGFDFERRGERIVVALTADGALALQNVSRNSVARAVRRLDAGEELQAKVAALEMEVAALKRAAAAAAALLVEPTPIHAVNVKPPPTPAPPPIGSVPPPPPPAPPNVAPPPTPPPPPPPPNAPGTPAQRATPTAVPFSPADLQRGLSSLRDITTTPVPLPPAAPIRPRPTAPIDFFSELKNNPRFQSLGQVDDEEEDD